MRPERVTPTVAKPRGELKKVFKVFFWSTYLVTLSPLTVTERGTRVYTPLKWLHCLCVFAAGCVGVVQDGYYKRPVEINSNPFYFLAYLRGSFHCSCLLITAISLCLRFQLTADIIQRLLDLDLHLSLSSRRMTQYKVLITMEALAVNITAIWFFRGVFTASHDSLQEQIVMSLSMTHQFVIVCAAEFLFANFIVLLTFFVQEVHERLEENAEETTPSLLFVQAKFGTVERRRASKLRHLRLQYRQLFDLKEAVNKVYSPLLLLGTLRIFSECVFFAFVNIIMFQIGLEKVKKSTTQLLTWVPIMLWKLASVCFICTSLTRAFRKTGLTLVRLRSEVTEREDKEEVAQFMREFKLMDPGFSACQLFNIDLTLFHSMIAVICMYVIILLQFQFQEDKLTAFESLLYYSA